MHFSHFSFLTTVFRLPHMTAIKNRFHHLRRRVLKDAAKGSRFLKSEAADIDELVVTERIRLTSSLQDYDTLDADLMPKISRILPYLASLSVQGTGPPSHSYPFGPFRQASHGGEQCRRCLLFSPSVQCGQTICESTGWCESCTRMPTYLSKNMLRECINLRRCQNDDKEKVIRLWNNEA